MQMKPEKIMIYMINEIPNISQIKKQLKALAFDTHITLI